MALPVSAGQQARIDTINAGIAGLPGTFNPRRRTLAFDTAASMNEQGLTWGATPDQQEEGGSIVWRIVRGQDGRLYRQAFRQNAAQFSARGTFDSSFYQRAQRDDRRDLDAARNAIMRQFGNQQADLTGQQLAEDQRLRGDLAQARGEYADWQAQQQVPTPSAPAAPVAGPAPAAAPGAVGANRAGNIVTGMRWGDMSPGVASSLAHKYPGYRAVRAGNGTVVLKKVS